MKLAQRAGVEPRGLAEGARIALHFACAEKGWGSAEKALDVLWESVPRQEQADLRDLILASQD